ncbi:PhnD/SsuA/transferrin family substrate-binding protein [Halohasta litorea]|uniref:PhnD/SsuA/transferrin family substrate-binding protein n=1 Tax=Halohasta litorea TaxID=869891 RepID=A0ABD6DGF1_9EURY|nr:PhnD/SsuA/transferrin family substrate-binding protein [Halohasta litorea]
MAPTSEVDASDVPTTTTSTEKRALSRRRFAAGALGAAGLTGMAGCSSVLGNADSSETITMLLTPDTPSDVRPQYQPVHDLLEGEIDGLDLEMKVPQDYSAVRPALRSEQAEIGMDDVTLISDPDMMDLFGTAVTGGTAFYFSMMLTKPESDIDERTDLEGRSVAFADRLSTSGSIFAVYALKEAGLDVGDAPDGPPVDFDGTWSNHEDAVQKVINDDADACCTWTGNGMAYLAQDQELPEEVANQDSFVGNRGSESETLRPFWWSFPIPKQPIYARQSWDSPMKEEIRQTLIDSDRELIEEYLPEDYNEDDLPFSTLRETTMDNYEPVITRLNDLGIELG